MTKINKTFDLVPKNRFDLAPNLTNLMPFDLVFRSLYELLTLKNYNQLYAIKTLNFIISSFVQSN